MLKESPKLKRQALGISIFFLLVSIQIGCKQESPENTSVLKANIEQKLKGVEGDFAIAYKNLADTSETILINEKEMFHAASTMKTPVMIEVFKQVNEGKFSLDDSILVKNEFRSIVDSSLYQMDIGEDSDEELYEMIGKKRTVNDLIHDMITTSSNLATNILVGKVGAENATQTMRSYGADSIMVLRGVEDIKAYERGMNNITNAYDLMIIFEKLALGNAVNEEASGQMLDILKEQEFNEMIPAQLPDSIEIAHKTGWITGVHHDSGVILLPDGRAYVLVMLSKNAPDREKIVKSFADISGMIYKFILAN